LLEAAHDDLIREPACEHADEEVPDDDVGDDEKKLSGRVSESAHDACAALSSAFAAATSAAVVTEPG
jgi:hypothetical protein